MSNGERGDGSSGARVVHVQRIFQDGDPQSNTWVDVERIDELHLIVAGTQRVHYIFNWDVLESKGYDGPIKTVVNPNDENSKIDIPVREVVHVVGPKGNVAHQFLNDASNLSRETHSRRIYHHAIKNAYLSEGKPPRDPQQYLNSLGGQDKDQFIDVEIIDAYITIGFDKDDIHGFSQILADGVPKDSKARTQRKAWQGTTDDPFMNEPLLISDQEGGVPGFMLLRNPDAGPQIDPPWRLDPLQNIVNVQWAGELVFVSKGYFDGIIYLGNAKGRTDATGEWQSLGSPHESFAGLYACSNSAYAEVGEDKKPTFILQMQNANDAGNNGAIIMTSNDGNNWDITWSQYEVGDGDIRVPFVIQPTGCVWSEIEQAFFAVFYTIDATFGDLGIISSKDGETMIKSADGHNWTIVSRDISHDNSTGAGLEDSDISVIVPYCDKPQNDIPGVSSKVCDGLAAYDKENKIKIYPEALSGFSPISGAMYQRAHPEVGLDFGLATTNVKIETEESDGSKTTKTVGIPFPCYAVGFTGGMWAAAGGEWSGTSTGTDSFKIVVSTDAGDTWKPVYTAPSRAYHAGCITGGRRAK